MQRRSDIKTESQTSFRRTTEDQNQVQRVRPKNNTGIRIEVNGNGQHQIETSFVSKLPTQPQDYRNSWAITLEAESQKYNTNQNSIEAWEHCVEQQDKPRDATRDKVMPFKCRTKLKRANYQREQQLEVRSEFWRCGVLDAWWKLWVCRCVHSSFIQQLSCHNPLHTR